MNNNLLLKNILSTPSFSSREDLVIKFVENYCIENNFSYFKDYKKNIYITKGSAEFYPCVVAHMDTVHRDQIELVDKNLNLILEENNLHGLNHLTAINPITGKKTGIGGDDKCGIYICLELLKRLDNIKVAFFVEEECGMLGSKNLCKSFFEDVGYALQFDAPTNNWFSYSCSGVKLWNENYYNSIEHILKEHNVDNISRDPFTDVVQLRNNFNFCCSVLPTGYYDQHSPDEFVIEQHTYECTNLGEDFIKTLGEKKYIYI